MKTAIDNMTLIHAFLKGEDSLLANRELRIEKAYDETQLLTTQGILLAKGRWQNHLPNVVIRLKSEYWDMLHQLALNAGFIPFNLQQQRLESATFAQYDHHSIPEGYQVHCQEASAFWKTWWINHRKFQLMDMLLLCDKRWYPVNNMLCETGTIYIKTWRGEKSVSITDTVIWLDRNTHEQRRRAQVYKHHGNQKNPVNRALNKQTVAQSRPPQVPDDLRSVIKTSGQRLIVHTVLGPIVIEGQNLTCTLARKVAKAPI